ncbi:MAG: mucoidy inhibitor MuiA family protein [Deltaproteobacteria bacterium]|nr:mucoidy inhibitor MuiA family protein [Deltaproteobacteria bacterium]
MSTVLSLLLLQAGPGSADRIERVTVFADRAEVIRRSRVSCVDGFAKARERGLPSGLVVDSVRAEGVGRFKTLGIAMREEEQKQEPPEELVLDEGAELRDRLDANERDSQRLAELGQVFSNATSHALSNGKADFAAWTKILDQLLDRRKAVARAHAEVLRARAELDRARAQKGGDDVRPFAPRTWAADVSVDCAGESTAELLLSYVTSGAGWVPEYDFRFLPESDTAGKGVLVVGAVVRQSTGESWDDVELSLSSARPKLGGVAPRPAPLVLSAESKDDQGKVLVQGSVQYVALTEPMRSTPPEEELAQPIDDRGNVFVLRVPGRASISPDGRPNWIPTGVVSAPATVRLLAAPSKSKRVFRVASFVNPSPHPLVRGRMRVFRGDSFLGNTQCDFRAPGERMEVSLGFDDELRVRRLSLGSSDERAGALSSTRRLERTYRITVENASPAGATIEVQEPIPVSQIEDVSVEVLPKTTRGHAFDAARGFLSWSLNVGPGKSTDVTVAYAVSVPDDWRIE